MIQKFQALDYTSADSFAEASYVFDGSTGTGWKIFRNNELYLELGPGYKLLKTISCGVCSTDLARRFLPFPLPQIIGHEVVAQDEAGNKFVIEINDTPYARDEELDAFSLEGIHTHSPGRMVLGIDRLPGGFGPWILAPVKALVPYAGLSDKTAVLVEPFAASLQAVLSSPPGDGEEVAVLGPRRLGSLVIAALKAYKNSSGKNFRIYGLARHEHLLDLSMKMGADAAIDLNNAGLSELKNKFSIVYDTTGTPDGLELALDLAAREVHLKSTNGQQMCGLKKLTELVVDELAILPFNAENLHYRWPEEKRTNRTVYAAPGVDISAIPDGFEVFQCPVSEAENILRQEKFSLPRFDIGIASTLEEIDLLIRPCTTHENSLIRPRSAILFQGETKGNQLLDFIHSGKSLHSSRCGDFHKAVELLSRNPEIAESVSNLVSAIYPSARLAEAFASAKDSKFIKVVVEHG